MKKLVITGALLLSIMGFANNKLRTIEKCLITDHYIGANGIIITTCKDESNGKEYYFTDSGIEVKEGSTYKITFKGKGSEDLDMVSAKYLY